MLRTVQMLHVSIQYKFTKYYNRIVYNHSKFYDIRTVRVFTIHISSNICTLIHHIWHIINPYMFRHPLRTTPWCRKMKGLTIVVAMC